MLITKTNPFSGTPFTMDLNVTRAELLAWEEGMKIQDAMPHLKPEEREFLMTGFSPREQKEIYGE